MMSLDCVAMGTVEELIAKAEKTLGIAGHQVMLLILCQPSPTLQGLSREVNTLKLLESLISFVLLKSS